MDDHEGEAVLDVQVRLTNMEILLRLFLYCLNDTIARLKQAQTKIQRYNETFISCEAGTNLGYSTFQQ